MIIDTDIVKSNLMMLGKDMKWPLDEYGKGGCVCVLYCQRHVGQQKKLNGKSAQSLTNTQHLSMKIWTNISVHQKNLKTHLLIYHSQRTQSSSWQVSLTCFTHTNKNKKTCLRALVMNVPKMCCAWTLESRFLQINSLQLGFKRKKIHKLCNNDTFPTHARGYI